MTTTWLGELPSYDDHPVTTTTLLEVKIQNKVYDDHFTKIDLQRPLYKFKCLNKTCLWRLLSYDDHLERPPSYNDPVATTTLVRENFKEIDNYLKKHVYDDHWATTTTQNDHPVMMTKLRRPPY